MKGRELLALLLVLGGAIASYALTGNESALLLSVVVGIAALLLATAPALHPQPDTPPVSVSDDTIDTALVERLADPVLVVRGSTVTVANAAARALLGEHILGEDVRVAIRHPAAAERLTGSARREDGAIHLVGLGTRDQRWAMRTTQLGVERTLVELRDETGNYAIERMRVDFVANASHELRTPLASILGFIETLADDAGDEPDIRRRFLSVMDGEARRMQRLIDDLISLSRIEAEKYRAPEQEVDIGALAREVCVELSAAGDPRGDDLHTDIADAPPVLGDRSQLSQLIHNIAGNAMKYGRSGTPVRIGVEPAGAMVRLTVSDEGEGIPPEHLPRLTERFYRVDSSRSRAVGGTGLGLAIVKHIVERHRGRLDLTSRVGQGTTVTILLPVAPSSSRNTSATGIETAAAESGRAASARDDRT
jgi:two-component system phosphate regulon sensor histidine kinase PhoR